MDITSDITSDITINTGAMPSTPPHALKPWETYALVQGARFGATGTSITFPSRVASAVVGTAAVGGSVLRDAGSVQGPPRVPR